MRKATKSLKKYKACELCGKHSKFAWWDYDKVYGLFGLCKECKEWLEEREKMYQEGKYNEMVEL